jgi:serpin B
MRNMTYRSALLLAGLTSLASFACGSTNSTAKPDDGNPPSGEADAGADASELKPAIVRASNPRDPAVAADIGTAVDANNAFAISLYSQASPAASGGNFLTSPISATFALTMTYAGAQGTTASQMASALQIPSGSPSIFDAQNALSQALYGRAAAALASVQGEGETQPVPTDYELQIVNSVWGETGYPWASPFLSILAKSYGTGVYTEDFASNPSDAESAINAWVSSATAGKINPLLAPGAIDDSTRMVLVNAIHVKLPWESPFDPSATAPGTFTRGDGSTVEAKLMSQDFTQEESVSVGYSSTSAGQFVSIPLAGNSLSVVFALPTTDLASLTASLTKDSFRSIPSADTEVDLTLPKFTLAPDTFSLASSLKALGMTQAFDPANADFHGICANTPDGQNLYIGDVFQKATLDVAENGVEAAAATAVVVEDAAVSVNPPTPIVINFNHPFLVSIVDESGAILFLGQVNDPTSSS